MPRDIELYSQVILKDQLEGLRVRPMSYRLVSSLQEIYLILANGSHHFDINAQCECSYTTTVCWLPLGLHREVFHTFVY